MNTRCDCKSNHTKCLCNPADACTPLEFPALTPWNRAESWPSEIHCYHELYDTSQAVSPLARPFSGQEHGVRRHEVRKDGHSIR